MISRILRNFGQVALDFATLKYLPPYLQHRRTIGLVCKNSWPCED